MDRKMYNGYAADTVKSTGATHCSIMVAAEGVVGRGVLLDIPRLRGVEWLEPGDAITVDELEACEEAQNVSVGTGDILLIGTGRDKRRTELGPWHPFHVGMAGLHPNCIEWLYERFTSRYLVATESAMCCQETIQMTG